MLNPELSAVRAVRIKSRQRTAEVGVRVELIKADTVLLPLRDGGQEFEGREFLEVLLKDFLNDGAADFLNVDLDLLNVGTFVLIVLPGIFDVLALCSFGSSPPIVGLAVRAVVGILPSVLPYHLQPPFPTSEVAEAGLPTTIGVRATFSNRYFVSSESLHFILKRVGEVKVEARTEEERERWRFSEFRRGPPSGRVEEGGGGERWMMVKGVLLWLVGVWFGEGLVRVWCNCSLFHVPIPQQALHPLHSLRSLPISPSAPSTHPVMTLIMKCPLFADLFLSRMS